MARPGLFFLGRNEKGPDHLQTLPRAMDDFATAASFLPSPAQAPPRKTLLPAAPDTAMPIGSATSQSFASFYLNGLDHCITHTLRVKGYVRYMDELLLPGPDSATPSTSVRPWPILRRELRLQPHSGKGQLGLCRQGIVCLGYTGCIRIIRTPRRAW